MPTAPAEGGLSPGTCVYCGHSSTLHELVGIRYDDGTIRWFSDAPKRTNHGIKI